MFICELRQSEGMFQAHTCHEGSKLLFDSKLV